MTQKVPFSVAGHEGTPSFDSCSSRELQASESMATPAGQRIYWQPLGTSLCLRKSQGGSKEEPWNRLTPG